MVRFDNSDDDLMAELSAAVAEERLVPVAAVDDARGVFQIRELDQEFALLTMLYDSLLDQEALVRGASRASVRTLTFQRGELSLEIEVTDDNIVGQVIPQQLAHVTLATRQSALGSADTDEWGSFIMPRPVVGSVRLIWSTASDKLVTDWFSL